MQNVFFVSACQQEKKDDTLGAIFSKENGIFLNLDLKNELKIPIENMKNYILNKEEIYKNIEEIVKNIEDPFFKKNLKKLKNDFYIEKITPNENNKVIIKSIGSKLEVFLSKDSQKNMIEYYIIQGLFFNTKLSQEFFENKRRNT